MRNRLGVGDGSAYRLLRSLASLGEGIVSRVEVFSFLQEERERERERTGSDTGVASALA